MKIKLRFDKHPIYEAARVWTEDPALEPVAGWLDGDLQSPVSARKRAAKMREVVAGTREPYQGSGNAYYSAVGPEITELGIDDRDEPITISVPTKDLIAAVEEWAAHLDHLLATKGTLF